MFEPCRDRQRLRLENRYSKIENSRTETSTLSRHSSKRGRGSCHDGVTSGRGEPTQEAPRTGAPGVGEPCRRTTQIQLSRIEQQQAAIA